MAFKYTKIGEKVATGEYAEAAKLLVERLVEHGGNQTLAAKAEGIDYRTLTRWLAKLQAEGFDVRGQMLDALEKKKQEAERMGEPPPPEPPKAGRRRVKPPPAAKKHKAR